MHVSLITAILIAFLLCEFEVAEAQNKFADCIRKSKAQNGEKFTDDELALLCKQQEEWEFAKENPPVSLKPKTPDQNSFLNKLGCKTLQECLGSSN